MAGITGINFRKGMGFRFDRISGDLFCVGNPTIRARITNGQFGVYGGGMPKPSVFLSPDNREFQAYTREFVNGSPTKKGNIPQELARLIDSDDIYPRDLMRVLGEADFIRAPFAEKDGGAGFDTVTWLGILEEIAKASASVGLNMNVQACLATNPLTFGSPEQNEKFLLTALAGEKIAAFGLTEPNSGSDSQKMETKAVRRDNDFVLSGSKIFITQGSVADFVVVFARTDNIEPNSVSAFIVEKGMSGYQAFKMKEGMLGMRGTMTSTLSFDNVVLPQSNLIGQIGDGKKILWDTLNKGRITISGIGIGIIAACLEEATEYSKTRKQFEQPLCEFGQVKSMLARMATDYRAARALAIEAALRKDRGESFADEASASKLFSSEAAIRAALNALQIHGGYGYSKEYNIERYLRDALLLTIGEGTTQMQELIISRGLIKD